MRAWLLFLLGAYHGLNPAMGWLFAVALGMQEKSGRAVMRSLLPLGVGHLASVGLVIGAVEALQLTLPLNVVKVVAAVALIGFGLYRLIRRRHPRWVGMQVGSRDLAFWSFLMASAHGAGLMLLPFVVAYPYHMNGHEHMHHVMMAGTMPPAIASHWWMPVGLHTLGYLLVTAAVAMLVYSKLGVGVLRRAWFNLELLWVGALIAMGILTLVL
jgi:uncharacterized membrane protein